jgi:hypothetical protein
MVSENLCDIIFIVIDGQSCWGRIFWKYNVFLASIEVTNVLGISFTAVRSVVDCVYLDLTQNF